MVIWRNPKQWIINQRVGNQPLKRFNRASGGPPSEAKYFPESMPIASGL